MNRWKYRNDLIQLQKEMKKETNKETIEKHTCPKCKEITFKDEIEMFGMCLRDYELHI